MLENLQRSLLEVVTTLRDQHQRFTRWLSRYHWLHQFVRTNELYFGGVLGFDLLTLIIAPLRPISWTICWRVGLILNVYLITQRIIQLQAGDK